MSWLSRPKDANRPKLGLIYRIMRIFSRSLISVWFRELDVVDNENIPQEGGILFSPNHQGAFLDPLLVGSIVNQQVTSLTRSDIFGGKFPS